MEQRDLIKDQIEQLGRVLGKIVAEFLGSNSPGLFEQAIQVSQEQMKSQLDIDIEALLAADVKDMEAYLLARKLAFEHFEQLSLYLMEIGKRKMEHDKEIAKQYFVRSLELINVADKVSSSASFKRIQMKSSIQGMLERCTEE